MKYKKLIVDDKQINVFLANSAAADDADKMSHLKGIEIVDATPEEFLEDYERRYGRPDIGDKA